jgi:hypothetical protein
MFPYAWPHPTCILHFPHVAVEKFGKQRDDDSEYNKDDQHGRFPGLTDVGMTSGVDGLNYSEPV